MSFFLRCLFLITFFFLVATAPAASQLENVAVKNFPALGAKVNGVKEKVEKAHALPTPQKNLPNSPFRSLTLADSFSRYKDSINASLYLLKASPYHLIYLGQTAKTIDTFLSKLSLTADAKAQFREQFVKVYKARGSEPYNMFKDMYRETIKLKRILDTKRKVSI